MDYKYLLEKTEIQLPLVALYDTPDKEQFFPYVEHKGKGNVCFFAYYKQWLKGKTLVLSEKYHACGGAGYWLFGKESRSRQNFVEFLVDDEGLKKNHALMNQWLDVEQPCRPENEYLAIGPFKPGLEEYLKTVTFFVTPDQLSVLMIGAQYFSSPNDPEPVISPFGSGCMQLLPLFKNLNVDQALIGSTDMAMRRFLPENIMAFTVTKSLFKKLCEIDEGSFLEKPFLTRLKKARA